MKAKRSFKNTAATNETVERIRKVVAQVCLVEVAEINKDARLLAFGLDSVRVLELMMCMEEEFEIQLEPGQLDEIFTVGELAEYVEGLGTSKQT